jgi:hypothetical protein
MTLKRVFSKYIYSFRLVCARTVNIDALLLVIYLFNILVRLLANLSTS